MSGKNAPARPSSAVSPTASDMFGSYSNVFTNDVDSEATTEAMDSFMLGRETESRTFSDDLFSALLHSHRTKDTSHLEEMIKEISESAIGSYVTYKLK
jgi:hypothetical protein